MKSLTLHTHGCLRVSLKDCSSFSSSTSCYSFSCYYFPPPFQYSRSMSSSSLSSASSSSPSDPDANYLESMGTNKCSPLFCCFCCCGCYYYNYQTITTTTVGRGSVGVCSVPCSRRVAGSNPPQAAAQGSWASPSLAIAHALRRETPIQCLRCSRKRL